MCFPTLRQASATDVDRLEDRLVEKVDKAELQVLVMAELQPLINTLDALPQRLVRSPRADHRIPFSFLHNKSRSSLRAKGRHLEHKRFDWAS